MFCYCAVFLPSLRSRFIVTTIIIIIITIALVPVRRERLRVRHGVDRRGAEAGPEKTGGRMPGVGQQGKLQVRRGANDRRRVPGNLIALTSSPRYRFCFCFGFWPSWRARGITHVGFPPAALIFAEVSV